MAVAPPLPAFDVDDVRDSVGETAFARGHSYARAKRVLSLAWDESASQLTASVVGNGAIYRTTAHFARQGGNRYFVGGECSCPIAYDCKHVAAVVVSATTSPGRRLAPAGTRIATPTPAPPPAWERPLRELVATREQHVVGAPLAIELSYATRHAGQDSELTARLMRPGARGKWINGSLSWRELESWHMRGTEILTGHLEVVREIAALFDAGTRRHGYYYGHSAQKTIDLATFDSSQLWHLLAEARRRGVALIHADPMLGDVRLSCDGELCLDVTRHVGDLRLRPVLRLGGETAELRVLQFVGSSGHGAICADIDETGDEPPRLHLVGFAAPTPEALRRMAIGAATIDIPAREADRFAAEISPSLRHVTTLISSDASFTPPQVSPPALTLRARYGDDHELELQWLWHYAIGDEVRYAAFDEPVAGYRDLAAEHAAAESATQAGLDLARFVLRDRDGRLRTAPVTLRGLDTAAFTTDLLPLLDEAPFTVERTGEPVDYRDASATLEVGVSTGEIAGERDWFDLGVQVTIEGRDVPLALVLTGLADGSGQLLLDDGALVSLDSPALDALRRVLADARDLPDRPGLQISRYQAGLWAELVDVTTVTGQAEAWQHQVGALLAHDELPEHEVPDGVDADLRPYQRDGFRWLAMLWEFELGGILADDMGLGKTLQALALIVHARREAPERGPFLVVAPTSVVSNWVTEAQRFTPDLRVVALTDTLRKSGVNLADVSHEVDVVVTTYTLARLDADAYQTVAWGGLLLDEAQQVKNHNSKTHAAVRRIDAPFKVAITGTPMENNLMELWSLLSITAPGLYWDPQAFSERFARPIERHGDREQLARLRRQVRPLMLRRTKELVAAELPAKQEQVLLVDLHPRHAKLYDTYLQRERQKILGLLDDFTRNRFTILRSITLLRQLALHPGLVDDRHAKVPCAKLDALVEHLEDVAGGDHRALVFSQFTGFLKRARERLTAEHITSAYLDGRTRNRAKAIETFKQGDDPVFLISLKAGGFGLNLTEADYCFLLDPWWNPATEAQAIDRTHRIGQTRNVLVYRVIARGTIEEKVLALAQRKAELFTSVLDDGDTFSTRITADDVRGLVS